MKRKVKTNFYLVKLKQLAETIEFSWSS